MAFCQKCGSQLAEGGTFCAVCGTPVAQAAAPVQQPAQPEQAPEAAPAQQPAAQQAPVQQPVYQQPVYQQPMQPAYNPADHTAEFAADDISKNKVTAMAAYMLGIIGIVIALLAAPDASFHSRQALKLEIVNQLILLAMIVLIWTFIVPIVGAIAMLAIMVIRVILFFQVCAGKAKDAPLIGSLPFLK